MSRSVWKGPFVELSLMKKVGKSNNQNNEWSRGKEPTKKKYISKPSPNPLKDEIKSKLSKYKKREITINELIKWITTKYYELKELNSIKNEKENIQNIKLSLIPIIDLFIRIGKTKNVKLSDNKIYSNIDAIDIIINKSEGYSDDNIEIITTLSQISRDYIKKNNSILSLVELKEISKKYKIIIEYFTEIKKKIN